MNIFTNEELEQLKEVTQQLKEFNCQIRMESINNILVLIKSDKTASLEDNDEIEDIYNVIENFYDPMILSYISLRQYLNNKTNITKIDVRSLIFYDRSTLQKLLLICIKNDLLNIDTSSIRVFINDDYSINNKEYYRKRKELINYAKNSCPSILKDKKSKKKKLVKHG